jgi:tetratricopeptide (TPR) repeat protein
MAKKTNQRKALQTPATALVNETPAITSPNNFLFFGILMALVFVAYSKVWSNNLVWDDDPYIKLNEAVKNFDLKKLLTGFHVGNYHPLTMLTLAIEYALVGEKPWLYHFDNLLLHTTNSFLLFKILQKLNLNRSISILSALFFALHPMHVESVAWAAERKDVLYTFFLFLSFWFYLKYKSSEGKLNFLISLIMFIAASLSKGMAVVLPALLLITDWWMLGKGFTIKGLIEKIPFFIVTFIFAFIATKAQKDAGADASGVISAAYSVSERYRIVNYAYLFYWIKTLWPVDLLPFYPYPGKPGGSIPGIYNLAAIAFVLFLGAGFWLGRKNKKIWWSIGFFTIAISTVIQILPVGSAIVADRYFYLSSVGPLFLMAYFLGKKPEAVWVKVGYGIAAIWLIMTFFQTGHWKNLYTLFKPAEKKYPEDAMVLSNLGWYYLAEKDFTTAKTFMIRADNNGFKNADVCRTIGSMYIDEGDYKSALKYLERAATFTPKSYRTEWLTSLAHLRLGEYAKALPFSEIAVKSDPENIEFLTSHSQILMNLGRYEESNDYFGKIIKLKPDSWDSYLNIAYSYRLKGDKLTEIKLLKELIEKAPDYLPAYRNIGVSLSELGRNDEVVAYWQRATVYDTTGDYEYNIGINYALRGKTDIARDWYIKAARKGKVDAINILKTNGVKY